MGKKLKSLLFHFTRETDQIGDIFIYKIFMIKNVYENLQL